MPGRVPPEVSRERERRAWELVQTGRTQASIAEELGITPSAVSQILDRVEARVLKDLEKKVDRQKARQTARLEHIYSEAMGAWERSKTPRKKSSTRRESVLTAAVGAQAKPTGVKDTTLNEASTTDGNFLFLQTAMGALGDLRKIWGLDAPKKVDVLDKRRPLEKLSDEELQRRAAENAALLEAAD